ncbi:MAG: GGDEF domain-containing protein [bacterium]|jgi:diguanylate cyclase|nr:GGDEF domain-containing protein [Betaproteobacteria bacterium]
MQSVKPAVVAPTAPAASTAKTPTDIARETLRMLSIRKLAPTPDNYQRFYEEISGTQGQHASEGLEQMLGALRELPRSDPALKEPVARLQRALVSRNWKAFGAEILALRETSPDGGASAASTAPSTSTLTGQGSVGMAPHGLGKDEGNTWSDTIRELLRQFERRHAAVSPLQKREGLERVLGAFGRSPLLKDKLLALVQSWGSSRGSGTGIDVAPADGQAAGEAMPLAAGALSRLDMGGSQVSSAETLRRLLAEVLRNDVAPRFVIEPALNSELLTLAELAGKADSAETCNELASRLDAFWKSAAQSRNLDGRLVPDLTGLVRLLVENIGELVDDDQWIGGQVEVMRQLMAQPLTRELLSDAQERFREIILRQGALKNSLADAKSTLKDMIGIFIERLGEMSESTAVYHDKIGVYADRIERTEDIGSLKDVLDDLMGDMRSMQSEALRSREDVAAARQQAEAAESKIRQLETELEEISEKVREDALTGSLNRRGLDEALTRETARAERYGNALCVSVIDLDNFKKLNDTHGHHAGDEALVHLVKVVKSLLRPSDTIGRFGGEEFVILLPETTVEAGKIAIERLQRELTKQFFLANNEKLLITFSAGVAQLRPGESEAEVVKRADQAMYRAKQAGKNRVFIDG